MPRAPRPYDQGHESPAKPANVVGLRPPPWDWTFETDGSLALAPEPVEDARTSGAGDGDDLAIEVPGNDNVYIGAEGEPALVLTGLSRSLRSSQSIPVTFVFDEAGEVSLDVPVAAEGQNPTPTYDFPDPAEDPTSRN